MKFSTVLYAVFGLSTFAAALPAPVAAPETGLLSEKLDLVERAAAPALTERTVSVDVVADVTATINAIVAINTKYSAEKPCTSTTVKNWGIEVAAQIQLLINVITAYPSGCTYPSIDVCVDIFVKLFVTIFVELQALISVGGLIATLLLTVDVLLSVLLGLVGSLLNLLVSLCILIEAKIQVGICQKIISACVGSIISVYLQVFVSLCVKAGLAVSL